jgi:uncharacterized protein
MPSYLRFALFFSVLLAALGGIDLFVYRRVASAFGLDRRGRRALAGVIVFGFVALVLSRALGRAYPTPVLAMLGVAGAAVQLGTIVAFAILGVAGLMGSLAKGASGALRILRREPRLAAMATQPPSPAEATIVDPASDDSAGVRSTDGLGRRELLGRAVAATAVTLGGGSALYGALYGRHDYVIEEVPVALERMPVGLDGFTIVQLSDVHLGLFVGETELRSMMEMVRRAGPDLVVLTGDLIDNDPRFVEMLGSMARRLGEQAPVVAIPGNHDYYTGIVPTMKALKKAGAEVLVNDAIRVGEERIAIVGVDDVWARRYGQGRGPNIERATRDLDRDLPRVLLCHNPSFFPEAAPHVDLQLSGHTHGGQFNPGVRPADLVLPYGYVAGRYDRDGAALWVNRGFGTAGPPARIGAAPEITKLILTA